MYKEFTLSVIWGGELRLFKVLRLLFLANVQGATFIPGDTSIPESRVVERLLKTISGTKSDRSPLSAKNH